MCVAERQSFLCPVCVCVCPVMPYHFVCNRRLEAYQIDALMRKRRLPRQMAAACGRHVANGGCAKRATDRETKGEGEIEGACEEVT